MTFSPNNTADIPIEHVLTKEPPNISENNVIKLDDKSINNRTTTPNLVDFNLGSSILPFYK